MNFETSNTSSGPSGASSAPIYPGLGGAETEQKIRQKLAAQGLSKAQIDSIIRNTAGGASSTSATSAAIPTPLIPKAPTRATNPFAKAGYAIEDLLVPKSETGQAIGLAASVLPFLKPLRYGAELPFVGKGLQAASEVGEARLIPALTRLGLLSGAGAMGAKAEGKSPVKGGFEGLGAGIVGEGLGVAFNPKLYSEGWWGDFAKMATGVLKQLPNFANDIRAGRNPIQALREIMPEASAVYGKSMQSISEELQGMDLFKHPTKKGWVDFETYKREIDKAGKAGWNSNGTPKSSVQGEAARAKRSQMVNYLQKRLDELSAFANNPPSVPPPPAPIRGVPTVRPPVPQSFGALAPRSNVPGPTGHDIMGSAAEGQVVPPKAPNFPELGNQFREANRQYEKVKIMRQFASNPDLIGRRRVRPEVAQKLVRDKLAPALRNKLSPLEWLEFQDSVFMGSHHGVDQVSAPGVMSRPGGPSFYGGGSSLRGRMPVPGEEKPNISQFVGNLPMKAKLLRLIGTLLGERGEQAIKSNVPEE